MRQLILFLTAYPVSVNMISTFLLVLTAKYLTIATQSLKFEYFRLCCKILCFLVFEIFQRNFTWISNTLSYPLCKAHRLRYTHELLTGMQVCGKATLAGCSHHINYFLQLGCQCPYLALRNGVGISFLPAVISKVSFHVTWPSKTLRIQIFCVTSKKLHVLASLQFIA